MHVSLRVKNWLRYQGTTADTGRWKGSPKSIIPEWTLLNCINVKSKDGCYFPKLKLY